MANKKQAQVITTANTQEITDMLTRLVRDNREWMKSTTQVKQHKQVTVIGSGEPEEDRKYGIQLVMERAVALKRKFRFSQTYEKTVTWREYYDIEAESLEEAREKAAACDGDLDDCEDAEFVEVEEDVENDIDAYQNRDIDAIYDPDGEEVE